MPEEKLLDAEQLGELEELVKSLFETLQYDITADVEHKGQGLYFNFHGKDQNRLADHRGETTRALATLLQEYWNHHYPDTALDIRCDIDGESQRQEAMLREQAFEAAAKLQEPGDSLEIGPFNSYERRIIHLALKEKGQIETQSLGEGSQKRIKLTHA